MDHELRGLAPIDVVRVVSLEQCQQFCLETRKYVCRSANYFHLRRECHVFGDDRTAEKAHLVEASRVDFFENQCLVETSFCPYQKSEEELAMVYVTKSLPDTPSTLHCERECNREREFNCRSYTFWNRGAHGSVCMLSAESRLTGQGTGLSFRQGATYSGKTCRLHSTDARESPTGDPQGSTGTTKGETTHPPRHTEPTTFKPPPIIHKPFPPHPPPPPPPGVVPPLFPPLPPPVCAPHQFTYEKVIGHEVRGGRRERVPTRVPVGVVQPCEVECQRLGVRCQGFVVQYKSFQNCYIILRDPTDDPVLVPSFDSVYFNKVCLRERACPKLWSFERYLHHELLTDPLHEVQNVPERADCEDLCLREASHCKSAVYHYHHRTCFLYSETKRSAANRFQYTNEEVEYLENQCVSESPTCQYREFPDRFLPQLDRLSRAYNLKDCQRQCDAEKDFVCRSVNFELVAKDCALSGDDVSSVPQGVSALQPRRNSLYSEKGSCEQVSVQCNPQDMLLTIHFDTPFHGRVYAKGNPSQCFVVGTGQTSLQFAISMGARCGTTAESSDQFVNEVVVQQHPVIMTDHDKTIKVVCSFETQERTYTMAGPGVGGSGVDVARTYNKAALTAVVTNTAPPPNVAMRVLDRTGQDARAVGLGEELTLKIELREASSAFAIFARNLYARSTNGESLFLIDSSGCPTDATIFPALELDPIDRKSLLSTFKAFRFPSSGMVNFEVQIRFCQEKCEQVRCGGKGASYGRRKRSLKNDLPLTYNRTNFSLLDDEDVYFDRDDYDTIRAVVQEESQSIVFPSDNHAKEDTHTETTTDNFSSTVYGFFSKDSSSGSHNQTQEIGESVKKSTRAMESSDVTTVQYTQDETQDDRIRDGSQEHSTELYQAHSNKKTVPKEQFLSTGEEVTEDSASDSKTSDISTKSNFVTSNENTVTEEQIIHETTFKTIEAIAASTLTTAEILKEDTSTAMTVEISLGGTQKDESSDKTKEEKTYDPPSSTFNRKFAFMHHEDNHTTTPMPIEIHPQTVNYFSSQNNNTDRRVQPETNGRTKYPRPDLITFDDQHSHSHNSPQLPNRPTYESDRRPPLSRTDPFSANRNPYSIPNRMTDYRPNDHQDHKLYPLPLNPQRLVFDSVNPQRNWNPQNTDQASGQPQSYPPLKSPPIEIHEMPNNWDSSKNRNSPAAAPMVPPYNIYNQQDADNRQSRVATAPPNFADRPREIVISSNPSAWGAPPGQQSPGIQIQRPLEILDHPNQRHNRHPGYPQDRPNSQLRPVEIPNSQDRNSYNQANRYDYNRPVQQQPRPAEQPQSSNPQPWNNRLNNLPTVPTVESNPWGNTRVPPRGPNRPEDSNNIHRQPYPQSQTPPRPNDPWRLNPQRPGSNQVPERNNFYASQPQFRPSEVIATTQKSMPEEVPLSLAILVGEDGKSQNSANPKQQQWRPPPTQYNRGLQRHNIINTPRPETVDEDKVCTSKATVIATAVSVTLVYLGVVAGAVVGYRWHRKNRRRKAMTPHPVHFPPNPANANVTYASPDITFRNVYGNFPVSSTSTT